MTPVHPHYPLAPAAIVGSAGSTPPAGGLPTSVANNPTTPPVVAGHTQSYMDVYPPTHPLSAPHEDAFQDARRFSHDQTGLANGVSGGSGNAPSNPDSSSASGYDPSPHQLPAYMRPHSPRASLGPSVLSTVHEQEVPSQYSFPTGHMPESFETTSPIQGPPNFFQRQEEGQFQMQPFPHHSSFDASPQSAQPPFPQRYRSFSASSPESPVIEHRKSIAGSTVNFPRPVARSRRAESLALCEEGPFFMPTRQFNNIYSMDQSFAYKLRILAKVDRGFFLADTNWTCYRRNYFQVSTAFQILNFNHSVDTEVPCLLELDEDQAQQYNNEAGPPDPQELKADNAKTVTNNSYNAGIFAPMAPLMDPDNPDQPLPPHEQPALFPHPSPPSTGVYKTIVHFSICISARVAQMEKKIDLVQHTPKRDRGPQIIPEPKPLRGGGNLNVMALNTPQNIVTFERVQFKTATANNGKRRAAQQYYVLQVDLYATTEDGRLYRVASTQSASLVVRGRSPGHYADNHERFSQHTASVPTSPTGMGFVDERRFSTGVIHGGYPYATAHHHGSHPYRQHPHSRSHSISAGVAAVSLDSNSPHSGHQGQFFDANSYGPLSPMSPGSASDYGSSRSYYGTPSHGPSGSSNTGGWHESSALSSPSSVYDHAGYSPFTPYPPPSSSSSSGYGTNTGPLSPATPNYPSSFGSTPQFVMTPDGSGSAQQGFDTRPASVHPFDGSNGQPVTPTQGDMPAPPYHGVQEHAAQQGFGSSAQPANHHGASTMQPAPLQTLSESATPYGFGGPPEVGPHAHQQIPSLQQQQQHHSAAIGYREQDSSQYSTTATGAPMHGFHQHPPPSGSDGSVPLTPSSSSSSNFGYPTSAAMTPTSTYQSDFTNPHAPNGTVISAAASTHSDQLQHPLDTNGYSMAPPPTSHQQPHSAYRQPPSGPEAAHQDPSAPYMSDPSMTGPTSQSTHDAQTAVVSERC